MLAGLLFASLVVTQALAAPAANACSRDEAPLIEAVEGALDRGDASAARQALAPALAVSQPCTSLELMRLSISAWLDARALAAVGGDNEKAKSVRSVLRQLDPLGMQGGMQSVGPGQPRTSGAAEALPLEAEYARTLIQAAIAAAQDERSEMELLLAHARDLVQRLAQRNARALWPRPFNAAAGELWFEVDRYDEAHSAYERAVKVEPTPAVQVGLARSKARLGRFEEACATYRRVRDLAPYLRALAAADLARCR